MRVFALAGACLALASLNGCGVPAAVSVASYAADGASFWTTGRSVTDHGLSILLQEDCAMFRIVKGEQFCQPMAEDDLVYDIAFAERTYDFRDSDPGGETVLTFEPPTHTHLSQTPIPGTEAAQVQLAVAGNAAGYSVPRGTAPKPPVHIVAGAFNQRMGAEFRRNQLEHQLLRAGHSDIDVKIVPAPAGSIATYIVVTTAIPDARAGDILPELHFGGDTPRTAPEGTYQL